MQTPASVARHPIHTMLVPVPIGLFLAALVFDLAYVGTARQGWAVVAFWDIAVGIVGALIAAVPGLIDYWTLEGPARRIANWHLALNLTLVGVFALDLLIRTPWARPIAGAGHGLPLGLTIAGVVIMLVSGWLGGELVYAHRVGVAEPERDRARAARLPRRAA
jgi:uncharacterized membrane protein